MSQHHPCDQTLRNYSFGSLPYSLSCLVSCHVQHCSECQSKKVDFENELAESFSLNPSSTLQTPTADTPCFDKIFQKIIRNTHSSEKTDEEGQLSPQSDKALIDGKEFSLPTACRSLFPLLNWKKLPNKTMFAKLDLSSNDSLFFSYGRCGSSVPAHTHSGDEHVYVLAGGFSDEHGSYEAGDYMSFPSDGSHKPTVDDPQGCFTITCLQGHISFDGIYRIFNPLSKWFFSK